MLAPCQEDAEQELYAGKTGGDQPTGSHTHKVEDFVDAAECHHLISLAQRGKRASGVGVGGRLGASEVFVCMCPCEAKQCVPVRAIRA